MEEGKDHISIMVYNLPRLTNYSTATTYLSSNRAKVCQIQTKPNKYRPNNTTYLLTERSVPHVLKQAAVPAESSVERSGAPSSCHRVQTRTLHAARW